MFLGYFALKLASAARPRKESLVIFSCFCGIIAQKKQTPLPINNYQLANYFVLKASLQRSFSDSLKKMIFAFLFASARTDSTGEMRLNPLIIFINL